MVRLHIYGADGKEAAISPLGILDSIHSDESVKNNLINNLFNSVLEKRGVTLSTAEGNVFLGPEFIRRSIFRAVKA